VIRELRYAVFLLDMWKLTSGDLTPEEKRVLEKVAPKLSASVSPIIKEEMEKMGLDPNKPIPSELQKDAMDRIMPRLMPAMMEIISSLQPSEMEIFMSAFQKSMTRIQSESPEIKKTEKQNELTEILSDQ
jgi:hypothetical protein